MILTRSQFVDHWNNIKSGMGSNTSPLWHPEVGYENLFKLFVNVRPVRISDNLNKNNFFDWCNKNCKGIVRCFSSNYTEEWWGFTNEDDIVLWLLKWT